MRHVLGVDTSSARLAWAGDCGYGYVDGEGGADVRRMALYHAAKSLFSSQKHNTLIVIEEPLSLRNGKTNRLLSLAAGAIWAAGIDCEVHTLFWANVSAWKKDTVGNGNASKEMVKAWALEHESFPSDKLALFEEAPDLYDAFAIWRYGMGLL